MAGGPRAEDGDGEGWGRCHGGTAAAPAGGAGGGLVLLLSSVGCCVTWLCCCGRCGSGYLLPLTHLWVRCHLALGATRTGCARRASSCPSEIPSGLGETV